MQNTSEEKQSILPLPASNIVHDPTKIMETQDFSDAEKCLVSPKTKTKHALLTAEKLESKVQQAKGTQIKLESGVKPVSDSSIVRASD